MGTRDLDERVRKALGKAAKDRDPDGFRNLLAFLLIGAFISVLPLLVFKTIPEQNKEIIVYIIGQISGMATTCLGFYFVTKQNADALDLKRAETTNEAFKAVTATAQASAVPTAPDAIQDGDQVTVRKEP
jgi:hypothetical protein